MGEGRESDWNLGEKERERTPSPEPPAGLLPYLEPGGTSRALFTSFASGTLSWRERCSHRKARERRAGAVSPSLLHSAPSPGLPVRDTYSRAGGSLGSSFSVFASRTLWQRGGTAKKSSGW